MKRIAILGSTGSIGRQTLDLAMSFPDRFRVTGLLAGRNADLLAGQVRAFCPEVAAVADEAAAARLRELAGGTGTEILCGAEGARAVASEVGSDIVVSAIAGFDGFGPTLASVRAGKAVALANKESLVAGGAIIMEAAKRSGARILPVDSEHSAIFQSMAGHSRADVRRIILTASGGPFAGLSAEDLEKVTMADTLRHPRWKMGAKVTVDSATLMNKGFEVIEAKWLFDIPVDRIEILIHRQSAIHSMVEYVDGSVVAQLGIADMRVPIAYALSYPGRLELPLPALDLGMLGSLTFERPDPVAFPAYTYAYDAARIGGSAPAALCAADDVAVEAFLSGRIAFPAIAKIIGGVLESHVPFDVDDEHGVFEAARRGRERARELACMCQGA